MSVLLDDQMNSVINCLTSKSTWDDLVIYHEGPSDVFYKSRVMNLKLCYNTFKFKLFQDSPDDEEDTRISQEYVNDLEEEYQESALLAKSIFFSKRGLKVPSYSSPFQKPQITIFCPSQQKPELRPNKDFEAKYNKLKAKLALISSDLVFVKSSSEDTKVSILGVERPWLSEAEGFTLPNHDTGRILPAESQVKITDPLVAITDSSAIEYDLVDESSVCSTLLPPLEKLTGAEPISGPKTIKSILKSN
ncbi:hypothetical protein Tco_0431502 [Tanacetum coccineum]